MKYCKVYLCGFWAFFLLYQTVDANSSEGFALSQDAKKRDLYQGSKKFKCPYPMGMGAFSDPEDCSKYYICVAGVEHPKQCRTLMKFDIRKKICLPTFMAKCGYEKDKTSTASTKSIATTAHTTTPNGDDFACSMFGSFPNPNDCSKYYSCLMYMRISKTCSANELFDAEKKDCKPENEVKCGNRQRPDGFTTTSGPDETSTHSKTIATASETSTESTTTETAPETTTKSITTETAPETTTESITTETAPETTTESITTAAAAETTTESIATETTTESITTETTAESMTTETTTDIIRPTGPPEHSCNENDLDCIITETGKIHKWFKCPQDVGFYPHQSSDKLFIFCMNWIPSVKKCGLDHVFSKERSTCV